MKRKICVVVNSRANYGRIKSFLIAAKSHPMIKLQLIVGASALLSRFGEVIKIIENDGFTPDAVVHSIVEGENPTTMAKSTGLGIIELATHFENLKPDVVLTVADRFETISTAIAASYMNIPLAHTQGGEITGSIDDSVRHAVTKLAHIHFPATEKSKDFLIKMGESPDSIFLTGCPSIDIIPNLDLKIPDGFFHKYSGVGDQLNENEKYIVVMQHPVTTQYGQGLSQIEETLFAVHEIEKDGMQVVFLWPNVDAGSDDIAKGIRNFREKYRTTRMHFFKNFSPEDYIRLLSNSSCIVGNSSSGIRESAFLGIPCVNIGDRQLDRERAHNVIDVGYSRGEILEAIKRQIMACRFAPSDIFGNGTSGVQIAEILSKIPLSVIKKHTLKENG